MITWEDEGIDYEYWGSRGSTHEWVLLDDDGEQPEDYDNALYISVTKNGKMYEYFVYGDIIEFLKKKDAEGFETDEEGNETYDGYKVEEIEENPLLICGVYERCHE